MDGQDEHDARRQAVTAGPAVRAGKEGKEAWRMRFPGRTASQAGRRCVAMGAKNDA